MAVKTTRRTSVNKKVEQVMVSETPVVTEVVMPKKSFLERMAPVLLVMVAGMAFLLGAMWSKLNSLESGGSSKTFVSTAKQYAKDLKLNNKKFATCMDKEEKKSLVESQLAKGNEAGVNGTPGFFVNGRLLGGAFPFSAFKELIDRELAGKGSDDIKTYSQELQDAADYFKPAKREIDITGAAFKGPENAPVTIVEFSDFQCPFCSRALPTIEQVMNEYKDKVKLVYMHMPLVSIHPSAQKAAEAAECARDQGKFWEMHDKLFEKQGEWSSLPVK